MQDIWDDIEAFYQQIVRTDFDEDEGGEEEE